MSSRPWGLTLFILLVMLISGALPADAQPLALSHFDQAQARMQMLAGINRYRIEHGLPMLQEDPEVHVVAERYARTMVAKNFFAHIDPWGSGPQERLAAADLPWPVSENLGAMRSYGLNTQEIVEGLLAALIDSPVHRANLLDPRATFIGLGFAQDKDNQSAFMDLDMSGRSGAGTVVVVQEFVRKPLKRWSGGSTHTMTSARSRVELSGTPVDAFEFVAVEILDRATRKLIRYQHLPVVAGSFAAQLQLDFPGDYEVRVLGLRADSLLQRPEPLGVFMYRVPEGKELAPEYAGAVF